MSDSVISFANVSRFSGEVLGINKVSLTIQPGIMPRKIRGAEVVR